MITFRILCTGRELLRFEADPATIPQLALDRIADLLRQQGPRCALLAELPTGQTRIMAHG